MNLLVLFVYFLVGKQIGVWNNAIFAWNSLKKTIGTDLAELLIKSFRFSGSKIID